MQICAAAPSSRRRDETALHGTLDAALVRRWPRRSEPGDAGDVLMRPSVSGSRSGSRGGRHPDLGRKDGSCAILWKRASDRMGERVGLMAPKGNRMDDVSKSTKGLAELLGLPLQPPKPTECPDCGCGNILPVCYGSPGSEMQDEARRGEIILGGCVLQDANWYCSDCFNRWPEDPPPQSLPGIPSGISSRRRWSLHRSRPTSRLLPSRESRSLRITGNHLMSVGFFCSVVSGDECASRRESILCLLVALPSTNRLGASGHRSMATI